MVPKSTLAAYPKFPSSSLFFSSFFLGRQSPCVWPPCMMLRASLPLSGTFAGQRAGACLEPIETGMKGGTETFFCIFWTKSGIWRGGHASHTLAREPVVCNYISLLFPRGVSSRSHAESVLNLKAKFVQISQGSRGDGEMILCPFTFRPSCAAVVAFFFCSLLEFPCLSLLLQ